LRLLLRPERGGDDFDHGLSVVKHIVVPETKHSVPLSLEPGCSHVIVGLLVIVLASIDLDDQPLLQADEVHDVSPERVLSAKPVSFELSFPQSTPQNTFGIGHVTTKLARSMSYEGFCHCRLHCFGQKRPD
jgi:hypothetical protein